MFSIINKIIVIVTKLIIIRFIRAKIKSKKYEKYKFYKKKNVIFIF